MVESVTYGWKCQPKVKWPYFSLPEKTDPSCPDILIIFYTPIVLLEYFYLCFHIHIYIFMCKV